MIVAFEHVSTDPDDRDNMPRISRNFETLQRQINAAPSVTIGMGAPSGGEPPGLYIDQSTSPPTLYVVT